MKDDVYAQPQPNLVDFAFDERVAAVFPDMIRRSVPGYELVVPMVGLMAARELGANDHVYDLGCSLGATSAAVLERAGDLKFDITAVDNSAAMLEKARTLVPDPRIAFREADVTTLDYVPSKVVISNWLLQFVAPELRLQTLARVADCLLPGGCLLLSEKVVNEDAALETYFNDVHLDFKRANGYSELEVSQKRSALENVMIIDSVETHIARLNEAGFKDVRPWYRCLNWCSLIAYR